MNQTIPFRTIFTSFIKLGAGFLTCVLLLSACAPTAPSQATPDMNAALTQVVATIQFGGTQTAEYTPVTTTSQPVTQPQTETPVPEPTAVRTPPALPDVFTTTLLNPLDTPHGYIKDTCQVLKTKWDPKNAVPGTVVMPIMFHSITKGEVTQDSQISMADLRKLMNDLHDMGFQAIDMQQAADFLNNNAKIPQRSVLLIVDDRKYREYFDKTFKTYYDEWGWKVVNAYITLDERPDLWQENAALESEGWVDHQAHGYTHNENITSASSEDYMRQELGKPFEMLKKYLNKTPVAYIWPGGSFTLRAAQLAREYKYQLGFTVNPRGPLMYNWIPLADAVDPMRPSYIPDGLIGDPLMTLPRYWDTDARAHLDTVRNISDEAAAYAEKNKAIELEYYDILCAPTYGVLSQP